MSRPEKHQRIALALRRRIRALRDGDRLPSIRALMRLHGVSQSTLDRALAELAGEHLIRRQWGRGVFVDRRTTGTPGGHTVGVMVVDAADPFCARLVDGIRRQFARDGLRMALHTGRATIGAELTALRTVLPALDAVIISPTSTYLHNPAYVDGLGALARRGMPPAVFVDSTVPGVPAPVVGCDNFPAFAELAALLAPGWAGFHRIVYVGVFKSIIGLDRMNGFRHGLADSGIPPERVDWRLMSESSASIRLAGLKRQGNHPSIIVAASPTLTETVSRSLDAQGLRSPRDVVLAGVVEEGYPAGLTRPMVRLIKPSLALGEEAARLIRRQMRGQSIPAVTRLPFERKIDSALRSIFPPQSAYGIGSTPLDRKGGTEVHGA